MANELNETTIIGRVGKTPESRYTKTGDMYTHFSVAVTKKITSENCPNGWKAGYKAGTFELTTWYRVTAWKNLAEIVSKYVESGRQVMVRGEMGGQAVDGTQYVRTYQTKGGDTRANYELTASKVIMLGSRNGDSTSSEGSQVEGPPPGFVEENEIPF